MEADQAQSPPLSQEEDLLWYLAPSQYGSDGGNDDNDHGGSVFGHVHTSDQQQQHQQPHQQPHKQPRQQQQQQQQLQRRQHQCMGVYAKCDIPRGVCIMRDAPLVLLPAVWITSRHQRSQAILTQLRQLPKVQQRRFWSLTDCWERMRDERNEKWQRQQAGDHDDKTVCRKNVDVNANVNVGTAVVMMNGEKVVTGEASVEGGGRGGRDRCIDDDDDDDDDDDAEASSMRCAYGIFLTNAFPCTLPAHTIPPMTPSTGAEVEMMSNELLEMGGLFPQVARIQHSCRPNVQHVWERRERCECVYTLRDIHAGEELFNCYLPEELMMRDNNNNRNQRRRWLYHNFRFVCQCEVCSD